MVKHYAQSTPFTTAAASFLSIINHFQPEVPLTKEQEFDIWHKTALLPTRASSIYRIALYAKKLGLNPKIVLKNKDYEFPDYRFYRYTKEDIEQAAFSSQIYLNEVEKEGIPIKIKEISLSDVIQELEKGKILLLRLNTKPLRKTKRNNSSYLVVYGYLSNQFKISDPLSGNLIVSKETMQEAFESLGTKKYRDNRMIIF